MPNRDVKLVGEKPVQQMSTEGPHDAQRSVTGIDLNAANEEQIAEIDMIGAKLAHAIVGYRDARGGFGDWEELTSVPGMDAMKIAELQRAARLGGRPS